jgi:hypothetical protein
MKLSRTAIVAVVLLLVLAGEIYANGREVQREAVARVVAVDVQSGMALVEREFRGHVWRLTLRVPPTALIFTCEQRGATLSDVRPGALVSVYYELMGREGLANLVVVEPRE